MSKVCQFNHCTLEAAFLHQLLSHPPLVPRKAIPVPNARYNLVGTPEGDPLYQTPDITWLVHQKSVSCTDGVP